MDWTPTIRMIYALTTLLIGLILSALAIYLGLYVMQIVMGMGSKSKKPMNWQKELKQGNAAVAIIIVAIIIAIGLVLQSGLRGIADMPSDLNKETFQHLIYSIIQICIGIVISIAAIFIGVKIFDAFTREIDEFEEIRKGNVPVALVVGAIIVAISFIIQAVVAGMIKILSIG